MAPGGSCALPERRIVSFGLRPDAPTLCSDDDARGGRHFSAACDLRLWRLTPTGLARVLDEWGAPLREDNTLELDDGDFVLELSTCAHPTSGSMVAVPASSHFTIDESLPPGAEVANFSVFAAPPASLDHDGSLTSAASRWEVLVPPLATLVLVLIARLARVGTTTSPVSITASASEHDPETAVAPPSSAARGRHFATSAEDARALVARCFVTPGVSSAARRSAGNTASVPRPRALILSPSEPTKGTDAAARDEPSSPPSIAKDLTFW